MKNHLFVIMLISYFFFTTNMHGNNNIKIKDTKVRYIDYAFLFQYRQNHNNMNRFKLSTSGRITSRYIRESGSFNISWITKDSFNDNKKHYSIFPILDFGLSCLLNKNLSYWEYFSKDLYSPYFLLNTSHYFLLNKMKENSPSVNIAFLLKNNTDLFVLKKNKWAQVSPGIGVRIFIGGMYGLTAEGGIENRSIYIFNENKYINKSSLFLSFGILLYPI